MSRPGQTRPAVAAARPSNVSKHQTSRPGSLLAEGRVEEAQPEDQDQQRQPSSQACSGTWTSVRAARSWSPSRRRSGPGGRPPRTLPRPGVAVAPEPPLHVGVGDGRAGRQQPAAGPSASPRALPAAGVPSRPAGRPASERAARPSDPAGPPAASRFSGRRPPRRAPRRSGQTSIPQGHALADQVPREVHPGQVGPAAVGRVPLPGGALRRLHVPDLLAVDRDPQVEGGQGGRESKDEVLACDLANQEAVRGDPKSFLARCAPAAAPAPP